MTGRQYIVVYTGPNVPSAVNVISQSFSNAIGATYFSAMSKTSSETLQWAVTGLIAGRTYYAKAIEVGSAGATASASMTFQTLFPFEARGGFLRKRKVMLGM